MDILKYRDVIKMELFAFDNFLSNPNGMITHFIEFLYADAVERKAAKEIQETWKQLYLWAIKVNDCICEDCENAMTLSTAEEAEKLLGQARDRTTGNEDVIWAARLLSQSFPYWGIGRVIKSPKAPEQSLACSRGIELLKEIQSYTIKKNLSEDVQKSWYRLYLWACSPKRNLSSDLAEEINLSSPDEAMALLRELTPITKGDAKVEESIEFLHDLTAWAKPIPCEACRIRESVE